MFNFVFVYVFPFRGPRSYLWLLSVLCHLKKKRTQPIDGAKRNAVAPIEMSCPLNFDLICLGQDQGHRHHFDIIGLPPPGAAATQKDSATTIEFYQCPKFKPIFDSEL